MKRSGQDSDRETILARRARFVATALASVGVGLSASVARGQTEDAGPSAQPDPGETSPRICLSDIQIEGELTPVEPPISDACPAHSDDPDCAPPHVCLSVVGPSQSRDYRHDGSYLRVGPVGGGLWLTSESGGKSSTASGAALGGGAAFGMTLVDGVVVGLGGTYLTVPAPNQGLSSLALFQIGPWFDLYPDPLLGWHAAVSLAPTGLIGRSTGADSSGIGFGGALWLGYDAWIGPEWSLGVAAGGLGGWASGRRNDVSVALRARGLALSASLVWH